MLQSSAANFSTELATLQTRRAHIAGAISQSEAIARLDDVAFLVCYAQLAPALLPLSEQPLCAKVDAGDATLAFSMDGQSLCRSLREAGAVSSTVFLPAVGEFWWRVVFDV